MANSTTYWRFQPVNDTADAEGDTGPAIDWHARPPTTSWRVVSLSVS